MIRLDGGKGELADDGPVPPLSGPDSLAYVMYTSGSTGRPKGVMIPHRAVIRLVKGTDYCRFGPDEVFMQLAPISFDASTFEIWAPFSTGAGLSLRRPGFPSFEEIGSVISSSGVTTLWLTSAMFNQVVDHRPEALRGVKQLLTGGDVLSVPHVIRFMENQPGTLVINGYWSDGEHDLFLLPYAEGGSSCGRVDTHRAADCQQQCVYTRQTDGSRAGRRSRRTVRRRRRPRRGDLNLPDL